MVFAVALTIMVVVELKRFFRLLLVLSNRTDAVSVLPVAEINDLLVCRNIAKQWPDKFAGFETYTVAAPVSL